MGHVIELPRITEKGDLIPAFSEAQDPEGTGKNCAVIAAALEDSLGGIDEARFEYAVETCECDTCR